MEKEKMEIRKLVELKEAAKYLSDFAAALEKGEVLLEQGEEKMVLTPAELVEVKVGAKSKKGKEKFSLEITWRASGEQGEDLKISSPDKKGPCCAEKADEKASEDTAKEAPAAPAAPVAKASPEAKNTEAAKKSAAPKSAAPKSAAKKTAAAGTATGKAQAKPKAAPKKAAASASKAGTAGNK